MKDETARPITIWVTQGLLALTSLFFLFLTGMSFFLGEKSLTMQLMISVLLVVFPAAAFVGLAMRSAWGRGAATVSLLCLWAFQMRTIWAFSDVDLFAAISRMSPFAVLSALFLVFFITVPILLFKLNREPSFFKPAAPVGNDQSRGQPLYIGDTVSAFDEISFDRQTERV